MARDAVDAAREGLRIVTNQYREGLASMVDLLDTQAAAIMAEGNLVQARHDYQVGLAQSRICRCAVDRPQPDPSNQNQDGPDNRRTTAISRIQSPTRRLLASAVLPALLAVTGCGSPGRTAADRGQGRQGRPPGSASRPVRPAAGDRHGQPRRPSKTRHGLHPHDGLGPQDPRHAKARPWPRATCCVSIDDTDLQAKQRQAEAGIAEGRGRAGQRREDGRALREPLRRQIRLQGAARRRADRPRPRRRRR